MECKDRTRLLKSDDEGNEVGVTNWAIFLREAQLKNSPKEKADQRNRQKGLTWFLCQTEALQAE